MRKALYVAVQPVGGLKDQLGGAEGGRVRQHKRLYSNHGCPAVSNTLDLNKIKIADSKEPPECELIFTNLVDTDMLYGHRNNWKGYGQAIEEIDAFLPQIMDKMTEDDILFITADHGCDPTVPGTDHTREQVPLLIYSKALDFKPANLGILPTFAYVAGEVKKWLGV